MTSQTIVWKEIWQRPSAVGTCVMAILLGVSALVAIRHITVFSEAEVGKQLQALGANILVLPKSATLLDYYSADQNGLTIPEEQATQILLAGLPGVERVSPRLCVPVALEGHAVTLVGILPQAEFESKAVWDSVGLLQNTKHAGCKKAACVPIPDDAKPEALATRRTVLALGEREAIVGADIARNIWLKAGTSIELFGQRFSVIAVLPTTGTIDDSRVFAHLHSVQELANAGEVVSAIEVMGCCDDAAGQLVPQLSQLLPDNRVVTISQVVQTQVGVNRLMAQSSLLVLAVIVLVGGFSVASTISANVRERRREIGTLVALGATPRFIAGLFLLKSAWLGLAGSVGGCILGLVFAAAAGSQWAGVVVSPLLDTLATAVLVAMLVTLAAAYLPARHAAQLDPCSCFQEV